VLALLQAVGEREPDLGRIVCVRPRLAQQVRRLVVGLRGGRISALASALRAAAAGCRRSSWRNSATAS